MKSLRKFSSKSGNASYSELNLSDHILHFKRDNTQKFWKLNLKEVYKAYKNESFLNTVNIKRYVIGRVYSPSIGILQTLKLIDSNGNRTYNS